MTQPKEKKIDALVVEASKAHCDLNILYGVIALLEGGTMTANCQTSVQRIITICQNEGQRCLRRYDKARERVAALKTGEK